MKSFAALLTFAGLAIAYPFSSEQLPLGSVDPARFNLEQLGTYPGVALDLNERRLIQVEGQSPEWVTELDKVLPNLPTWFRAVLTRIYVDQLESTWSTLL